MKKMTIAALSLLVLSACSDSSNSNYTPEQSNAYTESLSQPGRPDADKALDSKRLPDQVMGLVEIKPGMRVLDYLAGTGYYSELFSYQVGAKGTVFLHNAPAYDSEKKSKAIAERLTRLKNVNVLSSELDQTITTKDLDFIFLSKVFHDFYVVDKTADKKALANQLMANFYTNLKPGGKILVIDHNADASSFELQKIADIHRIPKQFVIEEFQQQGFKLIAQSSILANPNDNGTLNIWDAEVRGKTDKFILVFEK